MSEQELRAHVLEVLTSTSILYKLEHPEVQVKDITVADLDPYMDYMLALLDKVWKEI